MLIYKYKKITLINSDGGYKIKLISSSHYLAVNNVGDCYWETSSSSAALWAINEITTSEDVRNNVSNGTYNIVNQNVGGKPVSPPANISEVNIMTRYNAPLPFSGSMYTVNGVPDSQFTSEYDNAKFHCGSGFNQNGEFRNLNGNQVSSAILSFIKNVYGSSYSTPEEEYCYFLFGEHDDELGYHHGVDMQVSDGATIKTLYGGKVTVADKSGLGLVGIYVADLGVTTFYMHMKNISVSVGAKLNEGTPIGEQSGGGAGGRSHLHFEVRDGERSHASLYIC